MLLFSYRHVDLDGSGKHTVVVTHAMCYYTGAGNMYIYMCVCLKHKSAANHISSETGQIEENRLPSRIGNLNSG